MREARYISDDGDKETYNLYQLYLKHKYHNYLSKLRKIIWSSKPVSLGFVDFQYQFDEFCKTPIKFTDRMKVGGVEFNLYEVKKDIDAIDIVKTINDNNIQIEQTRSNRQMASTTKRKLAKAAIKDNLSLQTLEQRINDAVDLATGFIEDFSATNKYMFVNSKSMSDTAFNNVINNNGDKYIDFSVDFSFTKHIFGLKSNKLIFDIQDGMYEYMSKENNISKLNKWVDDSRLSAEALDYINKTTSHGYTKHQKIIQLIDIKDSLLHDIKNSLLYDIEIINKSIEILKEEKGITELTYKAKQLLSKNIININSLELAKRIINDTSILN